MVASAPTTKQNRVGSARRWPGGRSPITGDSPKSSPRPVPAQVLPVASGGPRRRVEGWARPCSSPYIALGGGRPAPCLPRLSPFVRRARLSRSVGPSLSVSMMACGVAGTSHGAGRNIQQSVTDDRGNSCLREDRRENRAFQSRRSSPPSDSGGSSARCAHAGCPTRPLPPSPRYVETTGRLRRWILALTHSARTPPASAQRRRSPTGMTGAGFHALFRGCAVDTSPRSGRQMYR